MLTAAIIGFGAIAKGRGINNRIFPLHHLASYRNASNKVRLTSIVEPDEQVRNTVKNYIPNLRVFENSKDMFTSMKPDIISICSPDKTHPDYIEEAIIEGVKGIWCEKPIAFSSSQARKLAALAQAKRIPIQVNFYRRFIKEIKAVADSVKNNNLGNVYSVNCFYPDTLIHNGSHIIDLLLYIFSNIEVEYSRLVGSLNEDGDGPFMVNAKSTKNENINLHPINRKGHNLIEWDFVCEKGRVRIIENGRCIELYNTIQDNIFPHLRILNPEPEKIKCNWQTTFDDALLDLINTVNYPNNELVSDLKNSILIMDFIDQVRSGIGLK